MSDAEGMNLIDAEAEAFARRIIAEHVDGEWLEWEDYPNLGEHAFERLSNAVKRFSEQLNWAADHHDRAYDMDSRLLIEQATS